MKGTISTLFLVCALALAGGCKGEAPGAQGEAAPETAVEAPTLEAPALLAELTIAPGDGEAVSLRYRAQPRGAHAVRLEQLSSQDRAGRVMDIGTEQTFTLTRELQGEAKDGRWTTALRFKDLAVKPVGPSKDTSMKGTVEAIKKAFSGLVLQVTLDGRGQVHKVDVKGGQAGRLTELQQVFEQLVKDSVVELPEQAVAPGDRWPTQRESLLKTRKSANKIDYDLSSTFLGYAQGQADCPKCAVVHTEGTFSLVGTITAPGMEGTSTGRGRVQAVVMLDVDAGRLVRSVTASVQRQTFSLKGKDGELTFTEEQQNRVEQTWLPPETGQEGEKTQ